MSPKLSRQVELMSDTDLQALSDKINDFLRNLNGNDIMEIVIWTIPRNSSLDVYRHFAKIVYQGVWA